MRNEYLRLTTLDEALYTTAELSAKTVLFDVEPLVAYWDTSQRAFDEGVAHVLGRIAAVPGVRVVCFTTNSTRRPSVRPACPGVRVLYLASAAKPFRITPYRGFPAPGVVIGDQILTDGLLASRLGYTFIHCTPELGSIPAGPWLLARCGRIARPLLFRRPG